MTTILRDWSSLQECILYNVGMIFHWVDVYDLNSHFLEKYIRSLPFFAITDKAATEVLSQPILHICPV